MPPSFYGRKNSEISELNYELQHKTHLLLYRYNKRLKISRLCTVACASKLFLHTQTVVPEIRLRDIESRSYLSAQHSVPSMRHELPTSSTSITHMIRLNVTAVLKISLAIQLEDEYVSLCHFGFPPGNLLKSASYRCPNKKANTDVS